MMEAKKRGQIPGKLEEGIMLGVLCVYACACMCTLRAKHRGSSVYAYAMLLRCDPVGMDVCCLIPSCFFLPFSLLSFLPNCLISWLKHLSLSPSLPPLPPSAHAKRTRTFPWRERVRFWFRRAELLVLGLALLGRSPWQLLPWWRAVFFFFYPQRMKDG